MRLLHTSDWHLGRSFHREDLLSAQAAWVEHLLEVVATQRVDVVLVSGDVYDRALPPVEAVMLADEAFARLAAAGVRVVISSGNHDSPQRLGFGSRLADAAGVHLRTDPGQVGRPVLIEDAHGPVAFHAIPYLEPAFVQQSWALPARTHQAALDAAMTRVRADVESRGQRAVVLAHAFVAGATPSESERDITVGGLNRVGEHTFDGVDYAALGHLHRPHELTERLRYSGSPLAYSFSEADQVKGSWLVELTATGLGQVEFVPAPVPRPMHRLRGRLADLLESREHAIAEGAWVQVTLTDVERPLGAYDRLRGRFPHLLQLTFEGSATRGEFTQRSAPTHRPHEVTVEFFERVRRAPVRPAERAVLDEVVEACCADPDLQTATG